MRKLLLAALAVAALALGAVSADEPAKPAAVLLTLEWEPYVGESLPGGGYVAELVKASFEASGYASSIKFAPWVQAVEQARRGQADGYLPEYYDESRRREFLLSDPFPGGALVLFKRKGLELKFDGDVEALRGLKLGVVAGYVNTKAIDEAKALLKEEAPDDASNMLKLASGRLDAVVIDRLVAERLLKGETLAPLASKVELVSPALEYKPLYVCFSKARPNAKALREAFNRGLERVRSGGGLDGILARHGIPQPPKP